MNIYLAIPIDNNQNPEEQYDRTALSIIAGWPGNTPLVIFKPGMAWGVTFNNLSPDAINYLTGINEYALLKSNVMIVIYRHCETWGVPHEMGVACANNIPIFVLSEYEYETMPIYFRTLVVKERVFHSMTDLAMAIESQYDPF